MPAAHGVHTGAPEPGAALPAAHGVGAVAPSEQAWPAGQVWQPLSDVSPVALPNVPESHGLAIVEPTGQKPPSVHGLHSVPPSSSWYSPATHGAHDAALGAALNVPVEQFLGAVEPGEHDAPAGHYAQSDWAVLPVALEWLPAAHSVGATAPIGQKWPGTQSSHAVSPVSPW